jgi:3'-phosphoadenosine 5'-phosphosulfate (PAPS) 3'-phosphatase
MHPFIEAARPLAVTAAKRLMDLRLTELVTERKADKSIVTNADREADGIIREGLRRAFPDHAILTEESGIDGEPTAEYVWVVDPLDGTKAYVNGVPGFSVMIGMLRRGEPYAGIVVDPWEGHILEAVRGMGTIYELNGERRRISVSQRHEWRDMTMVTSTGFPEGKADLIKKALPCPWIAPVNSVGIKIGFIVRGLADVYLNHHGVHFWDTCAPQVILEEAGGKITFLDESPLVYDLRGPHRHHAATFASNNERHHDALAILRPIMQRAG